MSVDAPEQFTLPEPEAPGPDPGQPGHFAHHDWLTAAVKALDEGGAGGMRIAQGVVMVKASALPAGTGGTFPVTFPVGRFTLPPIVMVTFQSATPTGSASGTVRAHVVTKDNFYVMLCNTHTTSGMTFGDTPCGWLAIQMSDEASGGFTDPGMEDVFDLR